VFLKRNACTIARLSVNLVVTTLRRIEFRNVALLVGTVVLCLTGLELTIRMFFPQTRVQPTGLYVPHETRIFDLAPNAPGSYEADEFSVRFTTNSLGLRDYEIEPKPPGSYRVLCVGDSFTMGYGVTLADSFPKRTETLLRTEHPEASISVVNFGVGSYGTIQELSKTVDEGFALEPDLVILQVFPVNDIRDNLRFVGKYMRSVEVEWQQHIDMLEAEFTPVKRACGFLRRHSHAFVFMHNRWLKVKQRFVRPASAGQRPYEKLPNRPWWFETSLTEYYPELEEGWQITRTALRRFRDQCSTRGIALYVLPIPARFELTDEMARLRIKMAEVAGGYSGVDPDLYDFSTNSRRTKEILDELAIPYSDLRARLLETDCPERYYWQNDGHLTPAGHEFVANVLKCVVWKEYCRRAGTAGEPHRTGGVDN